MSDLIERSEALKQLRLNHKDVVYIDKNECARRIEAIPSAEPTWTSVLAELHERFDALEKEMRKASAEMSAIIREYVGRPEGEWIDLYKKDGTSDSACCSRCGSVIQRPLGDFCRWCGADMRERKDFQVIVNGNCTKCGKPLSGNRIFICEECEEQSKESYNERLEGE